MKKRTWIIAIVVQLALVVTAANAQDYRGRIQGTTVDVSGGVLPGVAITLRNDATGVAVASVTDGEGRYIFDFVDPGTYTITSELQGFQTAEQKNIRVQQRTSLTVDLTLRIGAVEERVVVTAAPVTVQFKTGSSDITLEKELIDQAPIAGRNPARRRGARRWRAASRRRRRSRTSTAATPASTRLAIRPSPARRAPPRARCAAPI